MRIRLLGLLILFALMLTGCSRNKDIIKQNLYFYGENEEWLAALEYDSKEVFTKSKDGTLLYDCEDNEKLIVTYKGELPDLAKVRHVEIGYESKHSGLYQTSDYKEGEGPNHLSFTLTGGGKDMALIRKDEIITVTINMDGDTQILEIKNKSK